MLAPTSFLASYSPLTWYVLFVYGLSATIRVTCIWVFNYGFYYELTSPDAIMKLVEGVYMRRHEEDLVGEEEYYRMI